MTFHFIPRLAVFLASAAFLSPLSFAQIILTEVVDGTLKGSAPKFVEITNVGSTDFVFGEGGGLVILTNGDGNDLTVDFVMTGWVIKAGTTATLSADNTGQAAGYTEAYGVAPSAARDARGETPRFGNGNDGYALVMSAAAAAAGDFLDLYGERGVDGTGKLWEYTDSYAQRKPGITKGSGATFAPEEWIFGGAGALKAKEEARKLVKMREKTKPGIYR